MGEQDVCSNRRRRAADSYLPMQDETEAVVQSVHLHLKAMFF